MQRSAIFKSAVCTTAILTAPAAFADVSAEQVWEDWQSQIVRSASIKLNSESETYENGVLTITGLSYGSNQDGVTINSNLGDVIFTENADGTVEITLQENMVFTITGGAGDEEMNITADLTLNGAEIIASGDDSAITYDASVDRYLIAMNFVLDGDQPESFDLRTTLTDVTGTSTSGTDDEGQSLDYDLNIGALEYVMALEPTDGGTVDIAGQVNDLSAAGSNYNPTAAIEGPAEMALQNGLTSAFNASWGFARSFINIDSPESKLTILSESQSSATDFAVDASRINASVESKGHELRVVTDAMPMEFAMTADTYGFNMLMPLSRSDDAQDYAMGLNLENIRMGDAIWAMADPSNALSHDPITLQLDLSGQAKLFFDAIDPDQYEFMMRMNDMESFGELLSLNLNNLLIAFGGAQLTGTGAFTFDNSDLTTFDGMPRPTGSATIKGSGIDALMTDLETSGLPVQDAIMGARMMMGMFTQATGDDQVETTLEITDDAQILLNGQRIR
ncbi:hypothetical protein BVC71_06865 [Marivivens niveibacter]|uniref:DUF2125 domain-containing protein n=1 Tax=Marivivens niveibacter TaxID=1930667 RepID=A0A251WYZ3_9RHOB|nr:DUF2125 domain-containing protein [Marivivens niveibacter]OUD09566.1 hypothetical protein BVC71_06865 [Marivivens niveibacter]